MTNANLETVLSSLTVGQLGELLDVCCRKATNGYALNWSMIDGYADESCDTCNDFRRDLFNTIDQYVRRELNEDEICHRLDPYLDDRTIVKVLDAVRSLDGTESFEDLYSYIIDETIECEGHVVTYSSDTFYVQIDNNSNMVDVDGVTDITIFDERHIQECLQECLEDEDFADF